MSRQQSHGFAILDKTELTQFHNHGPAKGLDCTRLNIGIDLDNTLVNYEAAFHAAASSLKIQLPQSIQSKAEIREFLRLQPNGETVWQRLQGLAYGQCVQAHAKLYPGVKRFLWRCRQRGHTVTVISHKTEYGHGDTDKVPLRTVAIAFLTEQGLLDPSNPLIHEIVFKSSREEKILSIREGHYQWFIDDLPEVIFDLREIQYLTTIRFAQAGTNDTSDPSEKISGLSLSDWQQIDARINGEWTPLEIAQLSSHLLKQEVTASERYSAGGNAGVYRLTLKDSTSIRLKLYPVDAGHDRLSSEFMAAAGLAARGMQQIARPIAQDIYLGVGAYEWIDGQAITIPRPIDFEYCLNFLEALHGMRNSGSFRNFPMASAACISGRDIELQILRRISQFKLPRMAHKALDQFFISDFLPAFGELIDWAKKNWPKGSRFGTPLPRSEQTLSPSDFGFHNALRRPDGSLAFLDFEYFGWDDPVKLISDFSFHPGMNLSNAQKASWRQGALEIYGAHLSERLFVAHPLFGLTWCLILLNDFRPEVWQRRLLANDSKLANKSAALDRQLERAKALLNEIQLNRANSLAETCH